MHDYGQDFYGSTLKVCILGHLRPELNFDSLQSLIDAINDDIAQAKSRLDKPEALKFKHHNFFKVESDSNGESTTIENGRHDPPPSSNGHDKGV